VPFFVLITAVFVQANVAVNTSEGVFFGGEMSMFLKKICQKRSLYAGIKNVKKVYYIKYEMWSDLKIFLPFFSLCYLLSNQVS
jgi:hypothetical protein